MRIEADVADIRQTYNRKHSRQIYGKEKIKEGYFPVVKDLFIQYPEDWCHHKACNGSIQAHKKKSTH